jgi:hypothetical protein
MSLCCPHCGSNIFDGASCNECDYSISDTPLTISENKKQSYPTFYFKDPILKSSKELEKEKPPSSSGVYGWYFDEPPPYVPTNGCTPVKTGFWPFRKKWWLLYIGKASNLRYRVLDMHFNNEFWMKKSLSSLRLTLGCLHCRELGLSLRRNTDPEKDYTFGLKGDKKLSNWMAKHARVAFIQTEYIKMVETRTIAKYVLPLNYKDNINHPFAETLSGLRQDFKNIARNSNRKPKKKDFRKAYKKYVKKCKYFKKAAGQ